jgi:modulator of drug activity B
VPNIFIINAHEYYPFSEGRLNNTLVERAREILSDKGHQIRTATMKADYDVAADQVRFQAHLNKHFQE